MRQGGEEACQLEQGRWGLCGRSLRLDLGVQAALMGEEDAGRDADGGEAEDEVDDAASIRAAEAGVHTVVSGSVGSCRSCRGVAGGVLTEGSVRLPWLDGSEL